MNDKRELEKSEQAARRDDDNDDMYKHDLALNNIKWLICH